MRIHGFVSPGFERVREAFQKNFDDGNEIGAACCIHVGGKVAVDLWGGLADETAGRAWEADTPVLIFSSTKALAAICILRLVQRGAVDLDAPIAKYWPEFAAAGKESITVRWALAHRAGIPAIDQPFTFDDVLNWHGVIAAVAAQKPEWPPGAKHGYHARTFGWMAGEIVRRVTGSTLGRFFADEVARPLGVDCWIGLPEEIEPRLARITPPDPAIQALMDRYMRPGTLLGRVMNQPDNLFAVDQRWNSRPYHAAEIPSSNGIASARALSRIYAATIGEVDGMRLLDSATVDMARAEQSNGVDTVIGLPTRLGLGFALPPVLSPDAAEGSFGHAGAGGSLGLADPANKVAFGYVMNRMLLHDFSRANALVRALYQSL